MDRVYSEKKIIQVKLSLNQGLEETWNMLSKEYKELDKSGIIRLALHNLAKKITQEKINQEMHSLVRELESNYEGMSEEEFEDFWNTNKRKFK